MGYLKGIVDFLVKNDYYQPQKKLKEQLDGQKKKEKSDEGNNEGGGNGVKKVARNPTIDSHPFGGYLGTIVCLISTLSFEKNQKLEQFWQSEQGWNFLGLILTHTKLDVDNPNLRDYCWLFIRNITSWSAAIRDKLK